MLQEEYIKEEQRSLKRELLQMLLVLSTGSPPASHLQRSLMQLWQAARNC